MKFSKVWIGFDSLKEPKLYDTNKDHPSRKRLERADIQLEFKIHQTPLVEKYFDLIEQGQKGLKACKVELQHGYTYYITQNENSILRAKHELNSAVCQSLSENLKKTGL